MRGGVETNIKELRTGRNLTQAELASQIGTTRDAVAKWEQGVSLPRTADLPRLAAVLGVTVDELLREQSGEEGTA